jgi:hypothetical protein
VVTSAEPHYLLDVETSTDGFTFMGISVPISNCSS